MLIGILSDYMSTYRAEDGTPIFSGGSYFVPVQDDLEPTREQRELDVVDSFAKSISLALSTLRFLTVFTRSVRRPQLWQKIADLEAATSTRLTAAMVGLLRSFTVNVFDADSPAGKVLLSTLDQSALPQHTMREELRRTLRPIRVSLRDATLGLSQDDALDNENTLFECGWSWGITHDAPTVDTSEDIGSQPDGVALSDGPLRPWPLEDIPWRTTDDEESTYFSLLVSSVVLLDLLARRATDDDLTRAVAVLEELAIRGREDLPRVVPRGDPSTLLHVPGVRIELTGAEKVGPPMAWMVSDYTAMLLKWSVRAAELSRNSAARERLLTLAEEAMKHLWRRRFKDGKAVGLWDDQREVFPEVEARHELPAWHLTERIVESLVIAAAAVGAQPIRSTRLQEIAIDLLSEADHLFNQEQLQTADHRGSAMHSNLLRIETELRRARGLLQERPGTATAIIVGVLRELDEYTLARQDAARSSC